MLQFRLIRLKITFPRPCRVQFTAIYSAFFSVRIAYVYQNKTRFFVRSWFGGRAKKKTIMNYRVISISMANRICENANTVKIGRHSSTIELDRSLVRRLKSTLTYRLNDNKSKPIFVCTTIYW